MESVSSGSTTNLIDYQDFTGYDTSTNYDVTYAFNNHFHCDTNCIDPNCWNPMCLFGTDPFNFDDSNVNNVHTNIYHFPPIVEQRTTANYRHEIESSTPLIGEGNFPMPLPTMKKMKATISTENPSMYTMNSSTTSTINSNNNQSQSQHILPAINTNKIYDKPISLAIINNNINKKKTSKKK
eukprot:22133_1